MKKIYLQKITQYGTECYIGKIDPRSLVRVAEKIEMSAVQDAQRPLNEKRVKSIANYVDGDKGILPNTLTIATKDQRFEVHECDEMTGIYYIEFPETESEYSKFNGAIDVMDGQHRLYSFRNDICTLQNATQYEIGFTLYILPTLDERRRIFISCNEKQEKVSGNLLMWFRSKLNMLSNDEKKYYGLVTKLSNEYPLGGHIIMSAEKIKNGVKASEVVKALDKAKIENISVGNQRLSDDDLCKLICTYLSAWEKVVGFTFASSSQKDAGAAVKMAGLKYMLILLPEFWAKAISTQTKFDKKFAEDTIAKFIASFGVTRSEFFTCDDHKLYFREKTNTDAFAEHGKVKLQQMDSGNFNPLG